MYLNAVIERYRQLGAPEPLGCAPADIDDLERALGVRLPAAYREFLLWAGRSAGALFRGTDYGCRHQRELQAWARELLAEDGYTDTLPENLVVFSMHQGYQFLSFRTSEGDDPPLAVYPDYSQEPSRTAFVPVSPSLSAYLASCVEELAQLDRW